MENVTLDVTLQGYRDHIRELKKELDTLRIGSDEYKRVVSELNKTQTQYSQVLTDVKRGAEAGANSMNEMKDRLKALKAEAGNLDVGSDRFKELSKQILDTTNKLADLEAAQGTFSRRVGNYTGSIIDAFSKMGIQMGASQKAIMGVTQASTGLKDVMTVISKHPLLALITVIVTVLMKIKSAIDQNEEATEALQRGMSAFQPVLNLINKAFGFLAESVANAVDWLGQKMPKGLSVLGDAISFGNKAVGWLLEGIVNFATFGPRIWLNAFGKMVEGVGWLSDKLADFVDFLGMDGSGLRGMTDGLQKFIDGASNAVGNLGKKVKSLIDSGSDPIVNMFKKWANATETVYKNTQKQQELDKEIRQQSIESAKSEARQAELQRKIAQSTGEEKLKYMRELKKEIEDNGAREKRIAEEQLRLAQERAEWSPNSKEDNDYLAELEANWIRVGASVESTLAGIEKKEQKLEESIKSSSEKTAKEIAAKQLKISEEAYKKWQEKFSTIENSYSAQITEISTEEEQLKGAGLLSFAQLNEYENQKYDLIKNRNRELSKLYTQMVEDSEIDEGKKLVILKRYQTLQLQAVIDHNKHLKNLEEIRLAEIEEKVKKIKREITKAINEIELKSYNAELLNKKGGLLYELDNLKKLSKEKRTEILNALKMDNMDDALEIFGIEDLLKQKDGYFKFLKMVEDERHSYEEERLAKMKEGIDRIKEARLTGNEQILSLEEQLNQKSLALADEMDAERRKQAQQEVDELNERLRLIKEAQSLSDEELLQMQQDFYHQSQEEALKHAEILLNNEERQLRKRKDNYQKHERAIVQIAQQSFQSIASIMGDMTSLREADIRRRYDDEKITQEQAEKEFEDVKKMEIANSIMTTLASALQSQYSVWKEPGLPLYGKIAMSALLGAQTLASGYAQVEQIKNTKFGGSGSSSGSSSGGSSIGAIAVSPLLNYETDDQNATSLNDGQVQNGTQRVVIVQSDIVDTLNQNNVRVSQSTF